MEVVVEQPTVLVVQDLQAVLHLVVAEALVVIENQKIQIFHHLILLHLQQHQQVLQLQQQPIQ